MTDLLRLMRAQRSLIQAATADVPNDWTQFKVSVRPAQGSFDVRIDGPSLMAPSDDIYGPLREILELHAEGGNPLSGFTYEFTKDDAGWNGVGEFEYA